MRKEKSQRESIGKVDKYNTEEGQRGRMSRDGVTVTVNGEISTGAHLDSSSNDTVSLLEAK